MLVDIIIPAFNPGKLLATAIHSCIGQKYKNYTITVIDDASDEDIWDATRGIENLQYIRNEKNLGPGGARNVGIMATKGDLVSLLDADDIMHPNKLSLSVEAFEKNSELGMTCGNYRTLVNRRKLLRPFYRGPIDIKHDTLMKQNYVASGSTTIKRSVLEDVGLFNENYWISEDYDMWLRISEKYPIEYIHEVLYYYSVIPSGNSLTQRNDIQKDHIKNINKIREASLLRMAENK
jgi:glycosyltransferase involved in cell wall biosynthesis